MGSVKHVVSILNDKKCTLETNMAYLKHTFKDVIIELHTKNN